MTFLSDRAARLKPQARAFCLGVVLGAALMASPALGIVLAIVAAVALVPLLKR